jgi:hypothetical protein
LVLATTMTVDDATTDTVILEGYDAGVSFTIRTAT